MNDKEYDLRTQKVSNNSKKAGQKSKAKADSTLSKTVSEKEGVACASAPVQPAPPVEMIEDTPDDPRSVMPEMRKLFSEFSANIDGKLNIMINDLASVKRDLSVIKREVRDLEKAVEDTSGRIESVETDKIPTIESSITQLRKDLEDQLVRQELHHRKQNLLFYGIAPAPDEDVYATATKVISGILHIPAVEAQQIHIINAHRLPRRGNATGAAAPPAGPDPIIIRFGRMLDRDRIIRAYEREETERARSKSTQVEPAPTHRISVRSDLPPVMKRERGRLSAIAYNLRKSQSLKTKIKVQGTSVILLTRENKDQTWTTWSE